MSSKSRAPEVLPNRLMNAFARVGGADGIAEPSMRGHGDGTRLGLHTGVILPTSGAAAERNRRSARARRVAVIGNIDIVKFRGWLIEDLVAQGHAVFACARELSSSKTSYWSVGEG